MATSTRDFRGIRSSLAGLFLCLPAISSAGTAASDASPYQGTYQSWGRVCKGVARLQARSFEWRSAFSRCERGPYEVLDVAAMDAPPRIAIRIEKPSRNCGFEVIEIREEQIGMKMWSVVGYPSFEAYENRELPDWKDSVADDRMPLSCPLDPRDDPRHRGGKNPR